MSEPTPTQPLDHHQCRYLKMDGVRCGRIVPLGHIYCYKHRNNRDPSFVFHHGKRRVPLLEDVSSLQVTATAAVHGLLNGAIDRRDARTVLYGVHVAAGLLRFDLAEKRWLHQTGQTRPEPVTEFTVIGHEHLAVDDEPPAVDTPLSTPCSTLDPEEDFYTPEVCQRADSKMRVPLPPPGTRDPLGPDWPCPYRFEHCKGPGHAAACHYCIGIVRWEDVHPGEPDPGAPGPLPTVNLHWSVVPQRDIAALQSTYKPSASGSAHEPGAPSLSPRAVRSDRVGSHHSEPNWIEARTPLAGSQDCLPALAPSNYRDNTVASENPRAGGATLISPALQRGERPTLPPSPAGTAHETPAPPYDSDDWIPALTPLSDPDPDPIPDPDPDPDPIPDPNLVPVLVACADPHVDPIDVHRRYLCAPTKSPTSQSDAPLFDIHFSRCGRSRFTRSSGRGTRNRPRPGKPCCGCGVGSPEVSRPA